MTRATRFCQGLCVAVAATCLSMNSANASPSAFTRIVPANATILNAAPAFPGGGYVAENVLKPSGAGGRRTEYASDHLGEKTFIDFDFGRTIGVSAFRHVQRSTHDTIAAAELVFSNTPDFSRVVATVEVQHQDEPGATTYANFDSVTARYARWQVTSVLPGRSPNVGGQSIEFFTAGGTDDAPQAITVEAHCSPVIQSQDGELTRPLKLKLSYPYAEPTQAVVRLAGQPPRTVNLAFGDQVLPYTIPAADTTVTLDVEIQWDGKPAARRTVTLAPTRELTIYILPHSHTDIGYTAVQTDIEEKQINNLLQGLADARRTADYPEGARFVWNVEVMWAADLFLRRLPPKHRDELFDAVQRGQIALNGMYLNELTGLCRPEELTRLFRVATQLAERTGVPIDSAMISDVPGYTWGTVTAMNQAGIKYFSVAPNYFDRMGTILAEWENKPFWWIGPDGKSKVLVWIPFWGYATSHLYGKLSPQLVEDFCEGLAQRDYPYSIAYSRWAGHGDNGVPDPAICDFVKEWNANHVSPRFVISSTSEAFGAFERRYGDQLPQVSGDWTPYWEDGAGSSAAETAMNRASSDRLAQAETLWAMLAPKRFPVGKFDEAWYNVLMYSEHTWGAHCSISQPANPFTSDQWNIKKSYATTANLQSRQLLGQAAQTAGGLHTTRSATSIDVFNTNSWPRGGIVLIPEEISRGYNFVVDQQGQHLPTQRLASRELAVFVHELPPLAGQRLTLRKKGEAATDSSLRVGDNILENDQLRVRLDDQTGGIVELKGAGIPSNLVDTDSGHLVNDYLYLVGDDSSKAQANGPVRITIRDRGPLVASLLVESDAPGCHQLLREVRLTRDGDHVVLIDTVDKKRLEADSYHDHNGKESVNFAFPFRVPDGQLRLDIPYGVIRPELDQLPSACKNWLTVGRWADVSNRDFGITWVTLDAPLVQVGGLTATLLNSQTNPNVWRKTIEPTQKLYSWAMNNHWGTNYRAYQEGPVVFRYALRPHRGPCDDAQASRWATGFGQPLVAVPGRGAAPQSSPLVRVEPPEVIVTGLKPSDDGKAIIVRLFGASDKTVDTQLTWPSLQPKQVWLSDTSEQPKQRISRAVQVPAWGVVTLRAELPE